MSLWPNEPTGGGVLASWCRKLLRACRASELRPGVGYTVRRSSGGTVLEIGPRGVGSSSAFTVWTYRFKEMNTDTIVCKKFENGEDVGDNTQIYKPTKLWFSIASETIDGVVWAYPDEDKNLTEQTRIAHSGPGGTTTETQIITPRYLLDDIIYVVQQDGDLLDLNVDGRAWAKKYGA